jgi:tRNA 2-thiouridine synthesizing protein A
MKRDYDKYIDASGLKCPQPLLLAQQGIKHLQTDQILLLEATDPGTDLDLEVWCERFGHSIIQSKEESNTFQFWLRKG